MSGKARGGNDITIYFDGHKSNLHTLWDSSGLLKRINSFDNIDIGRPVASLERIDVSSYQTMEEKYSSTAANSDARVLYEHYITMLIINSPYHGTMQEWLKCPHTSVSPKFGCPEVWAQDVVTVNCQYVWNGLEVNGTVSSEYWSAIEKNLVFEELIMKAAVRLAAVLNAIFDIHSSNIL